MKRSFVYLSVLFVFFSVLLYSDTTELSWNTFLGNSVVDYGKNIAIHNDNNIIVSGDSLSNWGTPINANKGAYDGCVVKLDRDGNIIWNTFFGSNQPDIVDDMHIDADGNIYITGNSRKSFGTPVNPFAGSGGPSNILVVKLDPSGNRLWHTFLGAAGSSDIGYGIVTDSSGNVYVTGKSWGTWGSPLNPYTASSDIVTAKLNSSGVLQWHTFYGGSSYDDSYGITIDNNSNYIYTMSQSAATWGTPVQAYNDSYDYCIIKMDTNGAKQWHAFYGSRFSDYGADIEMFGDNIVFTGASYWPFGTPIRSYTSSSDTVVFMIDDTGTKLWHTFLGGSDRDFSSKLKRGADGNIYVAMYSDADWGSPLNGYSGNRDSCYVALSGNGDLLWNTFYGASSDDQGGDIVQGNGSEIYICGTSTNTWGNPVRAYSGQEDMFVADLTETFDINCLIPGGHGSATPQFQTVKKTADAVINIKPDKGYELDSIIDNGVPQPNTTNYTIYNVTEDHDVEISFAVQTFNVEVSVLSGNGTATADKTRASYGSNVKITFYPDEGYKIGSITDNENQVTVSNPYVISGIDENHIVEVEFIPIEAPPKLYLSGGRKTEKAWIITKEYAELIISIVPDNTNPMAISSYKLFRNLNGNWAEIKDFTTSGDHKYIDKWLEKGKKVFYKLRALKPDGTTGAESSVLEL